MATKCDLIRSQLHALEEQLRTTPKYSTEPTQGAKQPSKQVVNPAWANLDSHARRTRLSLSVCEESDR